MVDHNLVSYVQKYLAQGYTQQQIQQTLLSSGYSPQAIQETFSEIQRQKTYVSYPKQYQRPIQTVQHQNDHHHANKHILLVVVVIIAVIIISGLVFKFAIQSSGGIIIDPDDIDPDKYTTTTDSTTTTSLFMPPDDEDATIELFEILLCNDIDEYFNCYENHYDEYETGESVFIYFKLFIDSKYMSDVYKIGFIEDRQVIGPDGNPVNSLSYTNVMDITREVPDEGTYSIPVYNEILTSVGDAPGRYEVKINVRDKYSPYRLQFTTSYVLI